MLDRIERLPVPQRDALWTAFGISPGPAPDRFFIGLVVLSLLSDVAEEQPLVCVVDDEQWLDRASAQALAFVARRLDAESVGAVLTGPLDERVRDRIVAETRGNPLALLELPGG
jgi:predicted ATPase